MQIIIFDEKWSTPGGGMACCWEILTSASFVNGRKLPQTMYIQWLDDSKKIVFKTKVDFDKSYVPLADNLKGYTVKHNGRKVKPKIHIIIGLEDNGSVTVWLSNSAYKTNILGREFYIIGQAQATSEPWVYPKQ